MDVFSYVAGRDEAEAAAQARVRNLTTKADAELDALTRAGWQRVAERSALLALVKHFVNSNPELLNDSAWRKFYEAYEHVRLNERPDLPKIEAQHFAQRIAASLSQR